MTGWRTIVEGVVDGEPLFAVPATVAGLGHGPRPRAVYMGVGLCTRHRMAVGLPIDVLGMILPAERMRAAVGAESLVVLVADAHAQAAGFARAEVERRATAVETALLRIKCVLGLTEMVVLRASALQAEPEYRAILHHIRARGSGNPYEHHQTADVAFLNQALGGLLKLGWTVDVDGRKGGYQDEVAFDTRVHEWSDQRPAFAYVRCGRALDDRRPKVSPYVAVEPGRRLFLHPRERIEEKLAFGPQIASRRNVAAVRGHLERVTASAGFSSGSLEGRLDGLLSWLYPGRQASEPHHLPSAALGG